jgi:hypothetical protein
MDLSQVCDVPSSERRNSSPARLQQGSHISRRRQWQMHSIGGRVADSAERLGAASWDRNWSGTSLVPACTTYIRASPALRVSRESPSVLFPTSPHTPTFPVHPLHHVLRIARLTCASGANCVCGLALGWRSRPSCTGTTVVTLTFASVLKAE